MKGKEFKQLLKLNGLRQEDAAKFFAVSRQTISTWCRSDEIDDKIVKLIYERFRVTDPSSSPISFLNHSSNVVGNNHSNKDNRQYYIDSPDVLRAQVDLLNERIKEKDALIEHLFQIIDNLSSGQVSGAK